jgi:hypothetical protein
VKQKQKIIYSIVLLNFIIFNCCLNFNVKAQTPEHSLGFNPGTELVWEITQLDLSSFREVFGFDPNFELEDQIRMVIRDIRETSVSWIIDVDFWDYKTDWSLGGEFRSIYIGRYPENFNDYTFCLTPIDDYLEKVMDHLTSEYYRVGYSLFKQGRSGTGMDYIWEKEFDTRGILAIETRYDESHQVIVRLEGTFRIIPFGTYFIGFSIVAIVAIIFISLKKKKIRTTSF